MAAAIDPQSQSLLLSLPQEVRDNIYAHILSFRDDDFEYSLQPGYTFLENAHARPLPSAMLTCKRLYGELAPAVHGVAVMRATMSEFVRRIGLAVHGNVRLERLCSLVVVIAMEHGNWNSWLSFLEDLLERTGGLRELRVDWGPRPVVARGKGYLAGQEERLEERFFKLIGGLKELDRVTIHGDVAESWRERLQAHTSARVVSCKARWWREDIF